MLEDVEKSIRSISKVYRGTSMFLTAVVPIIIGLLVALYDRIDAVSPFLFWIPLFFLCAAGLLFSWATFDAVPAVDFYIRLVKETKNTDYLTKNIKYMSLLQETILAWNIISRDYYYNKLQNRNELGDAIGKICSQIVDSRDDFFEFERNEWWNFAVYLWSSQDQCLVAAWRDKHAKHPSTGIGRNWGVGEGHVGQAFRKREMLITEDAQAPEVGPMMQANNPQPYDDEAYRSYVSQPIYIFSGGAITSLGVLVATSNRPKRFHKANALVLQHAAGVLATTVYVAYDVANL